VLVGRDEALPLYVQAKGAKLAKKGETLEVSVDDQEAATARLADVSQVVVMGNVYGSCFFNVFILFIADLFYRKGALLGAMDGAHFAAAISAIALMGMGYAVVRSCDSRGWAWARVFAPAIPIVYLAGLYVVFILGQRA
jgi:Ca2+/Na+ antiporter